MAFFRFISDIMRKESQKNQNLIGEIVGSYRGDVYDIRTGFGVIKGISIISPGGTERGMVKTFYKNRYNKGDVVSLTNLYGNDSMLHISGKLDYLSESLPTTIIEV